MSSKAILSVLQGQKPERIPIWFMRQAGRYLPEYRQLRKSKGGFLDMVYDPQSACEITMQPIRRFGMDAAIMFSDILVVPDALGQKVEFSEGIGPRLEPIEKPSDVLKLNFAHFEKTLKPVYEAIGNIRKQLKAENFDQTVLIGFAGSPWTIACYMIEGQGSKDFFKVRAYAYQNPESFSNLIDLLTEATAEYLVRQVHAGAEVLQLFDSWSGALEARQFQKWVVEPTRMIIKHIKSVHPHIKIIGFPKGAGYNALSYSQNTGIDALGLDFQTPTSWASRVFQPHIPVQGNLDPACLLAGGSALELAIETILHDLGQGPFIFNLGHGIDKNTPIEHVEHVVKIVRQKRNQG
jgi:uroporphyrinogen decarboxylase